MQQTTNNSEVARLMAQIDTEREAMLRGLKDIAEGTARHSFINARIEHMWSLKDELAGQIGEGEAVKVMCRAILEVAQ